MLVHPSLVVNPEIGEVNMADVQATGICGNLNTGAVLAKVPFHGDTLEATGDGEWAVVKRLCENLGVAPQSQSAKLKKKAWATTTMIVAVAEDGKSREVFCVHRDSLAMWLATIEPSKVRPEIREKLLAYQKEAADVLAAHFSGRVVASAGPSNADLVAAFSEIVTALADMRGALATMAAANREPPAHLVFPNVSDFAGEAFARTITAKVATYAGLMSNYTPARFREWRSRAHNQLRTRVDYPMGHGRSWARLPARRRADVILALDEMLSDAKKVYGDRGQLGLVPSA